MGISIRKVAPTAAEVFPSHATNERRPEWASMIFSAIDKPMPVPPALVLKCGSKILLRRFSAILGASDTFSRFSLLFDQKRSICHLWTILMFSRFDQVAIAL